MRDGVAQHLTFANDIQNYAPGMFATLANMPLSIIYYTTESELTMFERMKKYFAGCRQKRQIAEERQEKDARELDEFLEYITTDEHMKDVLKKYDDEAEKYKDNTFAIYF